MRTTGIDHIVDAFLASSPHGTRQVVSLGAGSDTRFFRLKQRRHDLDLVYHELDFPANTSAKINQLRNPSFANRIKQHCDFDVNGPHVQVSSDRSSLSSPSYYIHAQDLRRLKTSTTILGLDESLPTLLISECCLIYLPPDDADAVFDYFSSRFPATTPLACVIYEPIRPHDSFGKTMISNLVARGIHLQTLEKYAGLKEQEARLRYFGFGKDARDGSVAVDIDFVWRKWINEKEKQRVEGLEWMDEVEEFVLLAKHYCIAWGWKGFEDDQTWRALPAPT